MDLQRTLADIALGPKPAAPRKDPPYDGRYALDWEGVTLSVPYWIANERDLKGEMPEIELGPVADWRVVGLDESRHGAAQAIRDVKQSDESPVNTTKVAPASAPGDPTPPDGGFDDIPF